LGLLPGSGGGGGGGVGIMDEMLNRANTGSLFDVVSGVHFQNDLRHCSVL
jgi:hypothetical protein